MNYTRDLNFVRESDYWVLENRLQDPIEDGGAFTQVITIRDATLIGSSTLSLTVN